MPNSVLSRRRSWIARFAVLAVLASMLVVPGVASAQVSIIDTTSSCPASISSAGFTDLAGLDATTVQAIDCIVDYGISKGTSTTTYSPANPVTRWQMALFLTRQATAHGVPLGDGSDQGFTDIGTLNAETQTAINQLKQLGVTSGTSATTYSPDDNVTRWQMALFLARLAGGAGIALADPPADAGFGDIATQSAEAQKAINQLAAAGVAAGTSATAFSPDNDVTRWQMALFLTRVLAADNITPGVTPGQSFTDMPELIGVEEVSFDDGDEELILRFIFDEDIDLIEDDEMFRVYEADGTQYEATTAQATSDAAEINALFDTIDEDVYDVLTVATVGQGAVEDEDGLNNPEGAVALKSATITGDAGSLDFTGSFNLSDVIWESVDVPGGTSRFLFEYDDDLTLADANIGAAPGNWFIVLDDDDGANPEIVDCGGPTAGWVLDTATDGVRDDQLLITCDAAIGSTDWARGIDFNGVVAPAGTVDPVWQAADERSTDAPDLVSIEFLSDGRAEFTFDEQVTLFGGEDDSDDDPGTEAAFCIYDEDGNVACPGDGAGGDERALVTDSNRVVRVQFDAADLAGFGDGDDEVNDDGVGGILLADAVQERFGDNLGNGPDEVRSGAGDDVDVDAGRTTDPDLVSVSDVTVSGTDLDGDPDEWEIVFTFDEDLEEGDEADGVCTSANFRAYLEDGTFIEGVDCDQDGDEATVTFDDEDVEDAVLGGVAFDAAEADDNTDRNPEGSGPIG